MRQIERARYATTLLQQGLSIPDVVYDAGYFDQPHLTRSLKRYIGQTPAQLADRSNAQQRRFCEIRQRPSVVMLPLLMKNSRGRAGDANDHCEAEVSIDGAMGGGIRIWQQVFPFHSADVADAPDALLLMPDALLMGRETYEGFAQVWSTRQGAMADRINSMPLGMLRREPCRSRCSGTLRSSRAMSPRRYGNSPSAGQQPGAVWGGRADAHDA